MRKNKQGISLIVLVITIIVMIILAATIIISLNNTGIIGAAENAVCKTNIKQAQNLAVLTWSNIYTKPDEYTMDNIEEKLQEEFKKNGLKYEDYNIEVTKNGINVSSKAGCVDSSGVEGGSGNTGSDVVPTNWDYAYSYDNTTSTWTTITTNDGTEPTGDIVIKMYKNGGIVENENIKVNAYDMIVIGTGELNLNGISMQNRVMKYDENVDQTIPSDIGTQNIIIKDGITSIADNWYGSVGLKFTETLKLPSTLKNIGKEAFIDFRISNVILPKTLETIGESAFRYCVNLEEIEIPVGIKEIKKYTFEDCEKLKKVTLPNNLESIGYGSFWGCKSVEEIIIPDSVTSIGAWAFASCEGLKNVKISKNITMIDERVFESTKNLKNVVIPDSVTVIKDRAFAHSGHFDSAVIPSGITSISFATFENCTIDNIYFKGTAEEWNTLVTNNELIVPTGAVMQYNYTGN